MGSPSIYVYDCSKAGIIIESFHTFSVQRENEMEVGSRQQYIYIYVLLCRQQYMYFCVDNNISTSR